MGILQAIETGEWENHCNGFYALLYLFTEIVQYKNNANTIFM